MERDFDALDKYLCDRDPMRNIMANYPEEDFTQKKLHEIIPRLVGFYKDILGAKDENGTPHIALFDKDDTWVPYITRHEFFYTNVRLALAMIKMESLEFDSEFFELVFSIPGLALPSWESKKFLQDLWKTFDFETDEEQDMIFKLLPLFRFNLDFMNEEAIDAEFLDSILSKPKLSFRILKFSGISPKGRTRIARTLRYHFYKLKEHYEQGYEMYYWYDDAVKRLHDFMKREFDDQRWLKFMQDLRKDRCYRKIPRLLTTLPNNLKVLEGSFPDQEKFPKLVEFLKDLTNRGLFEIIYPGMVKYARRTKKETMSPIENVEKLIRTKCIPLKRFSGEICSLKDLCLFKVRSELLLSGPLESECEKLQLPECVSEIVLMKI